MSANETKKHQTTTSEIQINWEDDQLLHIIELLTTFDELGFRPTVPMFEPENYGILWRQAMERAIVDLLVQYREADNEQ